VTDEVLHFVARVLIRLVAPQRAHRILVRLGGLLPPHGTRDAVVRAERRIRSKGTCLTRSLTVAARSPNADLVIGVLPPEGRTLIAHAWLEVGGAPLDASDVAGVEIARLRS
jgi:hypothetical protein